MELKLNIIFDFRRNINQKLQNEIFDKLLNLCKIEGYENIINKIDMEVIEK